MGGKKSKEKHKSAMFCPTNIVPVAGSVGLITYRDLPGAEGVLALMDTRTCTFIYIFKMYVCRMHTEQRRICIL